MAYTALYRKWRPQQFDEVRGQDHIVKTLKNQMNAGRVGHAYLFCGTRGTGKTTVAKIFARAVNCEHPENGSPCNSCPSCRAILSGTSVNVVEIDAASNNGVDNIREIREEVKYAPTEGKYRVYIIDEVHMLSAGAFNALLKTLEEPPEYVIFILATTEVHKIPVTVLSRCQRYDFRRLSMETLEQQLRDLLDAEKVSYEDAAVRYIARTADGSSRDALSLLEQCISFYYGEKLTYENILDVLGAVDQGVFSEMLTAVSDYDVRKAVGLIDGLMSAGRDLSQFTADFIWHLRNLLLIQSENQGEEVLGVSKENLLRMKEEAEGFEITQIMRYIRILSELSNEMRYSAQKRVLLELALLRMMQPSMEDDRESILDRIRFLEKNGTAVPGGRNESPAPRETRENVPEHEKKQQTVEIPEAVYQDYRMISGDWPAIVEEQSALLRSLLLGTKVSADKEGRLTILFTDEFKFKAAEKRGSAEELAEAFRKRYQKTFRILLKCLKRDEAPPKVVPGAHIPGIGMEISED